MKHRRKHEVTEHSYNVRLAMELGMGKAVLLKNFIYWIDYNRAHGTNFKKGRFWTYNSSEALAELFPYMKSSSIRRWLKELENDGWLVSDSFNKFKIDKTKWYSSGPRLTAFLEEETSKTNKIYDAQIEHRTDQNEQHIDQNNQSMIAQNEQPIPYSLFKPDTNHVDTEMSSLITEHLIKKLRHHFKSTIGLEDLILIISDVTNTQTAFRIINNSFSKLSKEYANKYNVGILEEILKAYVEEYKACKKKNDRSNEKKDFNNEAAKTEEIITYNIQQHLHLFSNEQLKDVKELIKKGNHLQAQALVMKIIGADKYKTAA